jgi:hypothetical protein
LDIVVGKGILKEHWILRYFDKEGCLLGAKRIRVTGK